jgi:hypothetical protein
MFAENLVPEAYVAEFESDVSRLKLRFAKRLIGHHVDVEGRDAKMTCNWADDRSRQLISPFVEKESVYYLYGAKHGAAPTLVATFDSEQQLLAYVRWATLSEASGRFKFEQGSALARFQAWSYSSEPPTGVDVASVDHNPTPSML